MAKFKLTFTLLFLISLNVFAFENLDSFHELEIKVEQLGKQGIEKSKILLVLDLDNTLLRQSQSLGSDQWFNWQEGLLQDKSSLARVANDFSGLLNVQGTLFALSNMELTEAAIPQMLNDLLRQGVQIFILTSRGYEFRDSTMKQLKRYSFQFSPMGYSQKFSHQFFPYEQNNEKSLGLNVILSDLDKKKLGISGSPRLANFSDGVFFSGGQNKGAMLLAILHLLNLQPEYVLFVDDHVKHVERVDFALDLKGLPHTSYRYSIEDERVDDFHQVDSIEKQQSTRQWEQLKQVLNAIFNIF